MSIENKWASTALCVAAALYAAPGAAHEGGMANAGYLGDTNGHLVTDIAGNCVRTSAWTRELALKECDPDLFPKETVKAEQPVAPPPPPQPEPKPMPMPMPKPVYQTMALQAGALFDTNKAELKLQGKQELDQLVTKLHNYATVQKIRVIGYTDSRGRAAYNQRLSERRADAVKAYLVSQGVATDKIETRGMGETRPIADNATAVGRAKNRRVEIEIEATQRVQ